MAWEQADRYLTGIGGTRHRRLIAEQLLAQARALANHQAQQQAERGISIAAAGMVGTSSTASGAASGGGAEHTIVELTAGNDEARKALAAADRHMAEALIKLRSAVEIWAEYARLAHTADEIDITPGLICQPTWQALRVVVPAYVREFKTTADAAPVAVGEPVYNFWRNRGRLPNQQEFEQWVNNDRRWPARGKKNR